MTVPCAGANFYRCSVEIDNVVPPGQNGVVRITSRSGSARFHLAARNGSGTSTVGLPLQHARVDITAKVGDSYRRIIQNVQVRSGVFAGFNDVLFGDEDICKDFELLKDATANYNVVRPNTCPLGGSGP